MEKDGQPSGSSGPGPTIIRPTNAPVASPSNPAVASEHPLSVDGAPESSPVPAVTPNPTTAAAPAPPTATPPQSTPATPASPQSSVQPSEPQATPASPPTKAQPAASPVRHKKLYVIAAVVVLAIAAGLVAWHLISENTWKQAKMFYDRKDYASAAKELQDVSPPSNPERLKIYAQSMLATRQLDKAMDGYQKLYAINKDPAVKLIIGNIYTEQKKTDEAVRTYQEVIKADPTDAQAYINLSTIYRQQGKTAEAMAIVEQAIAKNPNDTALLELRVTMLLDKRNSPEYHKAVDDLRKLNEFDPLLQSLGE